MPTVTLNKQVFEQLVGKKLPLEELKNRISMLGTDLEGIEGNEIKVEIFPNRPDLLSEQGFARAFSSFIGEKTGLMKYDVKKSGEKVIIKSSVKKVRPYTACAIVKNITIDDERLKEIIQIQEKLHITYGRNRKKVAIGVYPMEKITFPITYLGQKPEDIIFKPLEAKSKMSANAILEEYPTGKEYAHLLNGEEIYPVFRDASNEILSLPPIINSDKTGRVTEQTKDLFVECSGHDFEVVSKCLNMIVTALADMGAELYSIELEYENENNKVTPNLNPSRMNFDLEYLNKRLGLKLSEKQAVELLAKMGFGYDNGDVLIPSYRTDILHQIDFAEDIAIAYGYENFEEIIPKVATIGEEDSFSKFANKLRSLLIGKELLEVKNFHLSKPEHLNDNMLQSDKLIVLKNSVSEHNTLRNNMISGLLKNLADNQHNEYPQNIFEIGKVFSSEEDNETGVKETENLAVALCHDKVDFTEIKQILDLISINLGISIEVKETENDSYISGRVANVMIGGEIAGIIGEIHPQVLSNFGQMVPVVVMELNARMLFDKISS